MNWSSDMTETPEIPEDQEPEPTEMALDGVLDLHMFQPKEVKDLVPDWIAECRAAGILEVRIIHGKGIGVLRTIVQGILDEHPGVEEFGHPNDGGSWGATVATLKPLEDG
jgi:dsDNA-specific endonuclease/ATPase MutS2